MHRTADIPLPLREIVEPHDEAELASVVRQAAAEETPLYPLGGCTALTFGLPAQREGIGISLARMNRVVDYPARDMTVTVEAGLPLQQLQSMLGQERQWIPLDPPCPHQASVGGLVASNASGPRRYGYRTPREYVIGIRAVDGRGVNFQAGGRVVKNVAGFDFCRLLCGSWGMLSVITQVTWKLLPRPLHHAIMTAAYSDWEQVEQRLAQLNVHESTPVAVQLEVPDDAAVMARLGVAVEGPVDEVDWQLDRLAPTLRRDSAELQILRDDAADERWRLWQEFPCGAGAALRFRLRVPPQATVPTVQRVLAQWPTSSIMAQAGNGVIDVAWKELPADGLTRTFSQRLIPLVHSVGGHVIITYHATGHEMTHEMLWGSAAVPWRLMRSIKRQFDPHNILNPQRFLWL